MIKIGDRVTVKNISWSGNGTEKFPLRKADAIGVITSIKGITENHNNKHKYEVTYNDGRYYTNGEDFK
jgi:hypothetical protein